MLRLALCAPLVLVLAPRPGTSVAAPCANLFPHEPAVLYEISGGTLAGRFDLELAVYGDGRARLSSSTASAGGKCEQAFAGQAAVNALLGKLSAANAFRLCDNDAQITDMPLATLSVMLPKTNSSVHTMSWILADDSFAQIEQELREFQAALFPGF